MDITVEQLKEWLAILGKPTLGIVVFIILILYRDVIIHLCKAVIDLIFRRKKDE